MEEELEELYQAMKRERDKLRKELEQTQRAAQRSEEILTEENAGLREKLAKAEIAGLEQSLALAPSKCPTCEKLRTALDNIPRFELDSENGLLYPKVEGKWCTIAGVKVALASLSSPAPEKTPTVEDKTTTSESPSHRETAAKVDKKSSVATGWDHRIIDTTSVALCGKIGQDDDAERLIALVSLNAHPVKTIAEVAVAFIRWCQDLKAAIEDEGEEAPCDCDSGGVMGGRCVKCGKTHFEITHPNLLRDTFEDAAKNMNASPSLPSPSATEGGESR